MKILLTGATGFLGSALLKAFLQQDFTVCILKRSFSNTWRIEAQLDHVQAYDVNQMELSQVFQENPDFDLLVHTAANYGRAPGTSSLSVVHDNIIFPLSLAELVIQQKRPIHFINTDTFYTKSAFFYSHLAAYTLTKRHCLEWLKLYARQIPVINMRVEHVYGPLDREDKFVPSIFRQLLANVPAVDLTSGQQRRDFIFLDDVVSAYIAVIRHLEAGRPGFGEYEVGTGQSVAIKDFIREMRTVAGSKSELNFGKLPLRTGEIPDSQADTRALEKLGWRCVFDYKQGLSRLMRDFKKQQQSEA